MTKMKARFRSRFKPSQSEMYSGMKAVSTRKWVANLAIASHSTSPRKMNTPPSRIALSLAYPIVKELQAMSNTMILMKRVCLCHWPCQSRRFDGCQCICTWQTNFTSIWCMPRIVLAMRCSTSKTWPSGYSCRHRKLWKQWLGCSRRFPRDAANCPCNMLVSITGVIFHLSVLSS